MFAFRARSTKPFTLNQVALMKQSAALDSLRGADGS